MAQTSIKIKGMLELQRALEKLPKEVAATAERAALRSAMVPVLKSAKSKVSSIKDTGLLEKSLGIVTRKSKKRGITARVGARTGFAKAVTRKGSKNPRMSDPVKYAGVVEYGSSKLPARSFIRSSVESNGEAMAEALAKGYAKGFDRAVAKIRKK